MSWIEATPAGSEVRDGESHMLVHIRVRWWRPSFWREVRAMVDVEPRWMTWPVVAWLVLVFAVHYARRSES
jgi:hypothetical protein